MDQFPEGRFDDLTYLTATLGGFWADIYQGRELVLDYLRGSTAQERQLDQTSQELFDSMGRQTCPVFHTDLWYPILLQEAAGVSAGVPHFGDALVFGPQPDSQVVYNFGVPEDPAWAFPVPAELKACWQLADDIINPQVLLTAGIDFYLDVERQQLVFIQNPFRNARLTPQVALDGSRSLRLYLFQAQLDWFYLSNLYGTVLDLPGPSSEQYKALLNALLDAVTGGTSLAAVQAAVAAMTDVPQAQGQETVVDIATDANGLLIITEHHAYRFVLDAISLVEVGDTLTNGQQLIDAVQFFEPNDGVIPAVISQLSAGKGLLIPSIGGELIFENRELPLTTIPNVDGYTKVTFPLGGFATDVDAFFAEMHARGVLRSKTLANYLDRRSQPTTQPTADNLPPTINPLQLLFTNLFRYNTTILYLKGRYFGPYGAGIDKLRCLRKILPPPTALLVFIELEPLEEEVTMAGDGNTTSAGYTEDYELFIV